ncbi:hypothetical protein HOLleu_20031 [Holothuria leucospilota]|uniref:Uncharacterized protein n=1 Tax=Holothuria leucospilota TaxID=206669 RepID=A0A9Q1C043_HOLLE|nr:hypothetical protein HOLleu_20031 [Holothuria leucospilota]
MHPKFPVYNKVSVIDQLTEVEKAWEKLRWENYKSDSLREGNSPDDNCGSPDRIIEGTTLCNQFCNQFYNRTSRTLNLSTATPTSLPFNKWVYRPPPHKSQTEARMIYAKQKIKEELIRFNRKGQDNISKEAKIGLKRLKERVKKWENSTTKTTTSIRNVSVTTTTSTDVNATSPIGPLSVSQGNITTRRYTTVTTMITNSTTVATQSSMDVKSTSPTLVSQGVTGSQTTSHSPIKENNRAALVTTLPIVAVIFLFLLLVGFIFLRKKSLKDKRSKQAPLKSHSKDLELGDMKDSSNDYGKTDEDGMERKLAFTKQNATSKLTSYEVGGNAPPAPELNTTQRGIMVPPDNAKACTQGSHEYEEAKYPGTQRNDEYEEVTDKDKNQGYEKAKGRGNHADQGHEVANFADGPFYQTLNPDAQNESSYTSVCGRKQDGGYDALERQKIHVSPRSKTDPNYDLTDRIWKGDPKIKSTFQIGGEYSVTCSSSANTSDYDKLEHTTRNRKPDNISPNEYNILQPKRKV